MEVNELSKNARGGTELMLERLHSSINKDLIENFQIIPSRVRELDETKIRVLWLHDLPGDPESEHLKNRGWEKFHKLVFVSNWQMQAYVQHYNIPWSHCIVLQNAIQPLDFDLSTKTRDKIRLIYHTTPHRGLNILVPVFKKLCETHDNIELDVYSSFKIYGWESRDEQYKQLFDDCKNTPNINYHGFVPNEEIRTSLTRSHIFAYPSIWTETSCLALIEAMSAGNICVHPNLGALYETAANWTHMYQWNENPSQHANMFYSILDSAIKELNSLSDDQYRNKIMTQKSYTDIFYQWNIRKMQWEALLYSLIDLPREIPKQQFVYKTP
jgi:glycosyltransferase involved in cell wall biosynthesis